MLEYRQENASELRRDDAYILFMLQNFFPGAQVQLLTKVIISKAVSDEKKLWWISIILINC